MCPCCGGAAGPGGLVELGSGCCPSQRPAAWARWRLQQLHCWSCTSWCACDPRHGCAISHLAGHARHSHKCSMQMHLQCDQTITRHPALGIHATVRCSAVRSVLGCVRHGTIDIATCYMVSPCRREERQLISCSALGLRRARPGWSASHTRMAPRPPTTPSTPCCSIASSGTTC